MKIYRNNFSIESCILSPFNVYRGEQCLDFLISKIIREKQTLGKVQFKDLDPRRDFFYNDDEVEVFMKPIEYSGPHRTLNMGTGKIHLVREIIQTFQPLLRRPIAVTSEDIPQPSGIMDSVSKIELSRCELDWLPRFSLSLGLARMIVGL